MATGAASRWKWQGDLANDKVGVLLMGRAPRSVPCAALGQGRGDRACVVQASALATGCVREPAMVAASARGDNGGALVDAQ